jgi:hypothetical protein
LFSLPESSYKNFTVAEWGSIVLAILILSRLTFMMAATLAWDADSTRSNIPMSMYLDCLCYRFQQLSITPADGTSPPKNPDVLFVFKMVLESVKKSYERRVAKIEPGFFAINHGTVVGVARGHCPMHDPTLNIYFDKTDSAYESSFDLSGNGSSASVPASTILVYHDLWATMTGNWAEEF